MRSIGVVLLESVSQYFKIVIVGISEGSENDVLFLVKDFNIVDGGSLAPSIVYTTWVGESTDDCSANILNAQTCASQPQINCVIPWFHRVPVPLLGTLFLFTILSFISTTIVKDVSHTRTLHPSSRSQCRQHRPIQRRWLG